nr:MAG TPA: hypothetical protein [Caudoviricetes sp.]
MGLFIGLVGAFCPISSNHYHSVITLYRAL